MTGLIIIITFVLLAIVVVQIARINEISKRLRGEEEALPSEIRSDPMRARSRCGALLPTVGPGWRRTFPRHRLHG